HCFASLWTPQALAYRRRFNVGDLETPCAVVICRMVGDETTGPSAGSARSAERAVVRPSRRATVAQPVSSRRRFARERQVRDGGRGGDGASRVPGVGSPVRGAGAPRRRRRHFSPCRRRGRGVSGWGMGRNRREPPRRRS
ncbi:MAG TPA: hypothetical protein EYQ83_08545, partial [Acidobacteria bacterium]|nr:hypothetical protein [Acidobacteriota bacterium]